MLFTFKAGRRDGLEACAPRKRDLSLLGNNKTSKVFKQTQIYALNARTLQEPQLVQCLFRLFGKLPLVRTRVALGAKVTGPKDLFSVTLNMLILKIWKEEE